MRHEMVETLTFYLPLTQLVTPQVVKSLRKGETRSSCTNRLSFIEESCKC